MASMTATAPCIRGSDFNDGWVFGLNCFANRCQPRPAKKPLIKTLTMRVCNCADIYDARSSELFVGHEEGRKPLEFLSIVREYLSFLGPAKIELTSNQ